MIEVLELVDQYPGMVFSLTCYPKTYDLGDNRWEAVFSWIKKVKKKEEFVFLSNMASTPEEAINATIEELRSKQDAN